jgi:hypothetical protein
MMKLMTSRESTGANFTNAGFQISKSGVPAAFFASHANQKLLTAEIAEKCRRSQRNPGDRREERKHMVIIARYNSAYVVRFSPRTPAFLCDLCG